MKVTAIQEPGTAKLSASGSQKESLNPQPAKISRISLGCGRRESGCNWVARLESRPFSETFIARCDNKYMVIAALYGFVLFGCGLIVWSLVLLRKSKRAQSWPTSPGTILYSMINEKMANRYPLYRAEICYEYVVNGKRYDSNIWRLGARQARLSWPAVAQRAVARYPSGKSVTVFYNPENPHDALLEPGKIDWTGFAMGLFFVIVAAAGIITNNS